LRSHASGLEAQHTTPIEGIRLTLEQAERLLAGETVAGTDPDDAREPLNYRDAFECVSAYLNDGGPITEGLIREIHRRLVAEVRGGSAALGEYRRVQNYMVNAAPGRRSIRHPRHTMSHR
jgi:Fic family protein